MFKMGIKLTYHLSKITTIQPLLPIQSVTGVVLIIEPYKL